MVMSRSSFDPHLNPAYWIMVARQILSLLRNRARPVLIGEVSLWISMSLKQTEILLDMLVEKDLVKRMTEGEMPSRDAVVLVDPKLIPMGDYDQIPISILGAPPNP